VRWAGHFSDGGWRDFLAVDDGFEQREIADMFEEWAKKDPPRTAGRAMD
jgi:hypothetical protein